MVLSLRLQGSPPTDEVAEEGSGWRKVTPLLRKKLLVPTKSGRGCVAPEAIVGEKPGVLS